MNQHNSRILIVDDDSETCDLIVESLSDESYSITVCIGGEQALDLLDRECFDLVLADIKMPHVSGVDLLQHIRQITCDTKVILMTAYASIDTAIQAVRHDASDYLIKPFAPKELRRRVRDALMDGDQVNGRYQCRDLRMDLDARRVWVGKREVELTRQEFEVLKLLFRHKGCTVSWHEFLQGVWGIDDPGREDVGILRSCIRRIRQKLGDNARDPKYIYNRWGEGYRLGR